MRFLLIALLALWARVAGAQAPSVPLPPELDRVLRDYENAWASGNPEAVAKLFAPDGYALPSRKPHAKGHEAIKQAYAGPGGALRLRAVAYATGDSIGYIIGAYRYGEREGADAGKFLLALKKERSGRWLIAADMDNSIR